MTGPRLLALDEVRSTGPHSVLAEAGITGAALAGHFPGDPVLPAVFVVDAVLQAVGAHLGRPARLSAVDVLRVRRALTAGQRLRLAVTLHGGTAAAVANDGAATVALTLGEPVPPAPSSVPPLVPPAPPLVPLLPAALLPHRPPMLLVDRVLELSPGRRVVAEHDTQAGDAPYPAALVVESFAQAAALLLGGGRTPAGTLALGTVRAARLHGPVPPGATLRHEVRLLRSAADTAVVSGVSRVSGQVCLTVGTLVAVVRPELVKEAGCTT